MIYIYSNAVFNFKHFLNKLKMWVFYFVFWMLLLLSLLLILFMVKKLMQFYLVPWYFDTYIDYQYRWVIFTHPNEYWVFIDYLLERLLLNSNQIIQVFDVSKSDNCRSSTKSVEILCVNLIAHETRKSESWKPLLFHFKTIKI